MTSWVSNISWDSSAIGGMTTAAPTPTTAAPTVAPTPVPATVAPSYPMNPNYAGGGVIFPLPVAPSLLMDGDISALSPITPAPTTAAPLPETLAPIPPSFPMPMEEEEPEPFWTWQKIALAMCAVVVLSGVVWWFFIRKKGRNNKGNNRGNNNNNGRRSNVNNNRGRNNARAAGAAYTSNYNDTLDNWRDYYNNSTTKTS